MDIITSMSLLRCLRFRGGQPDPGLLVDKLSVHKGVHSLHLEGLGVKEPEPRGLAPVVITARAKAVWGTFKP